MTPSRRAMRLADDVRRFVERHYERRSRKLAKNSLFREFYRRLLGAVIADLGLRIPKCVRLAFLALVGVLVVLIHRWDDYIDKRKWAPSRSRKATYNAKAMNKLRGLLGACGLGKWTGFEASLDYVEKYFGVERRILATGQAGRGRGLRQVLGMCNCDYAQYDAVFTAFLVMQFGRVGGFLRVLRRFMKLYVVVDIVCDHITDLMDDIMEDNFNVIRWQGGADSFEELVANGTLQRIAELGLDYAREARKALAGLESYPAVHEFASRCLEGEAEGLRLVMRYRFFIDQDPQQRQGFLDVILKPFPWERLTREEVSKWLENLPGNGHDCTRHC